jgi:hypothetical protein
MLLLGRWLQGAVVAIGAACVLLGDPITSRAQDDAAALAKQIDALVSKLSPEAAKNAAVQEAVTKLLQQLLQDEDRFGDMAGALGSGLKKKKDAIRSPSKVMEGTGGLIVDAGAAIVRFNNKNLSPDAFAALKKAVEAAVEGMAGIEVSLDRTAAATHQMKLVTGTIANPKSLELGEKQLIEAAKALSLKLVALAPGDFRINVVSAWYGDIRQIRHLKKKGRLRSDVFKDRWRVCSATRVVRTACQGQVACTFPTEGTPPTSVTGESLCGYDPVQFAADPFKTLFIQYECIPLLSQAWKQSLGDYPVQMGKSDLNEAVLRNTGKADFRCQPQPPKS